MSSPTWYDLLDVEPAASTDEIRTAWKHAVADLDPTDRRFQRLSEAAAVLLDPARRESYDTSLSAEQSAGRSPSPGESAGTSLSPAGSAGSSLSTEEAAGGDRASAAGAAQPAASRADANGPERSEDRLASARRPRRDRRGRRAQGPGDAEVVGPELPNGAAASAVGDLPETEPGISDIEPASVEVEYDPAVAERSGSGMSDAIHHGIWRFVLSFWGYSAMFLVAAALVALAAFAWTRSDPRAIERDADAARSAAERAVVPVLSYDYRTLAEGQKEAESWLTPRYRDKDYRPLFATIKENAPGTQTVVTTKVIESGIVRAGEGRVEVLLLVDRPTTNKLQTTPVTYEDHVTVTMEQGDDGWLIDGMST